VRWDSRRNVDRLGRVDARSLDLPSHQVEKGTDTEGGRLGMHWQPRVSRMA